MIRLDMSEYQNPGAARRMLGDGELDDRVAGRRGSAASRSGRAARRVREGRPGRLRPVPAGLRRRAAERPARRAGRLPPRRDHHDLEPRARRSRTGGLGFSPAHAGSPRRSVQQAVTRAFRPEFLNRIDRTVVFRPLSRPVMREILGGRARGGARAARAARAPVGGRVRRLGARVPARRGLHARPRRAAAEARGRAALPHAAGAGDRRPRLPGRRPVPVRARGRGRR